MLNRTDCKCYVAPHFCAGVETRTCDWNKTKKGEAKACPFFKSKHAPEVPTDGNVQTKVNTE